MITRVKYVFWVYVEYYSPCELALGTAYGQQKSVIFRVWECFDSVETQILVRLPKIL